MTTDNVGSGQLRGEKLCTADGCEERLKARGMCRLHYERWLKSTPHEQRTVVHQRKYGCSVQSCAHDGPSFGKGMCAKHYYRTLRHGHPEALLIGTREYRINSQGYIERRYPNHPIVPKNGWMHEHRAVLFDKLSAVRPECHWCSMPLRWDATYQEDRDYLVVDHLDWNKQNNDPSNLVPACMVCNIQRVNPLVRRGA